MELLAAVILPLVFIWLALAVLSAKWSSFRPLRVGYMKLLRAIAMGAARWLWRPEFPRQGGGEVVMPSVPFEEDRTWDLG